MLVTSVFVLRNRKGLNFTKEIGIFTRLVWSGRLWFHFFLPCFRVGIGHWSILMRSASCARKVGAFRFIFAAKLKQIVYDDIKHYLSEKKFDCVLLWGQILLWGNQFPIIEIQFLSIITWKRIWFDYPIAIHRYIHLYRHRICKQYKSNHIRFQMMIDIKLYLFYWELIFPQRRFWHQRNPCVFIIQPNCNKNSIHNRMFSHKWCLMLSQFVCKNEPATNQQLYMQPQTLHINVQSQHKCTVKKKQLKPCTFTITSTRT